MVDQVTVTEVLSITEAEEDERLTVGAAAAGLGVGVAAVGLGVGVVAAGLGVGVASSPPPPHVARKMSNEHLNNNFTTSNQHIQV